MPVCEKMADLDLNKHENDSVTVGSANVKSMGTDFDWTCSACTFSTCYF